MEERYAAYAVLPITMASREATVYFDPQARFSCHNFMVGISEVRLTAGHFFAIFCVLLYFVGVWRIIDMLQSAGAKLLI